MAPVFHGGAAIYRLTPCSAEVAWDQQPRHAWQLPPPIRATLPPGLIEASHPRTYDLDDDDDEDLPI